MSIPTAQTTSPLTPYQLIETKTPHLKDYHCPVCLDAALLAEGTLHDGVQGHQGDVFKDPQMGVLANGEPLPICPVVGEGH